MVRGGAAAGGNGEVALHQPHIHFARRAVFGNRSDCCFGFAENHFRSAGQRDRDPDHGPQRSRDIVGDGSGVHHQRGPHLPLRYAGGVGQRSGSTTRLFGGKLLAGVSSRFSVLSKTGTSENRELEAFSSYQGVGTLSFRASTIYLGA